ncbi:MAG: MFS transporter, partial [Pseudonocardia sp.]|nr:MFS transporter [Pseudonocardia sp.]
MPSRRWIVLVAGLVALAAGCAVQYGTPFLIPALLADGLSLSQAGLLAGCPVAGLLVTLLLWGVIADRWGERLVLTCGLGLGGATLLVGGATVDGAERGLTGLAVTLLLAGAATAAVHAASGRLVLGWFQPNERGRAMAVRQCAQPLGVAAAALALPTLAGHGPSAALLALGGACLFATALVIAMVRDPRRPDHGGGHRAGSPYRGPTLWRIHGASSLLVVPQF